VNREKIEVGAFSKARIQRLYNADAVVHWQRCEAEGLQCPQEVFAQLFTRNMSVEGVEKSGGPLLSDLKAVAAPPNLQKSASLRTPTTQSLDASASQNSSPSDFCAHCRCIVTGPRTTADDYENNPR
jgi:hypothetical protein